MRMSVSATVRRVALVAVVSTPGLVAAADAGGAAGPAEPAVGWEVVDLGFGPEGVVSQATAINDRGLVAGYGYTPEGGVTAYLWRRGRVVELGPGVADDVNNRGVVAVTMSDERGVDQAAIWQDGRMQELTAVPGSYNVARAINDRGEVVGFHPDGLGFHRGFVWHRGRVRDLLPVGPSDAWTWANDIDEDGTVVGYSCGVERCEPARWRDGVGEHLPMPSGALWGEATAIDGGRTVGASFFRDVTDTARATQWDVGGGLRTLDVPGADSVGATGIAGRFVSGWALDVEAGRGDAVAWRDGVAHVLPTYRATDGARAEDVDARGHVVGWIEAQGQEPIDPPPRAVLWRPTRSS